MRISVLGACSLCLSWFIAVQPVSAVTTFSVEVPDRHSLLTLQGYASPGAFITILESNTPIGTTVADGSSYFTKTFTGLNAGTRNIGIYGVDTANRLTSTTNLAITVPYDTHVTVSDFFLSPTFQVEKDPLRRPDREVYSGLAKNNTTVRVIVDGGTSIAEATVNASGVWQATSTDVYHLGQRSAQSLAQEGGGDQSDLSDARTFTVTLSADLNLDTRVSLVDFSILMFNFDSTNPPNWAADINDEGVVDLVDFSIMMFYWNGDE